MKYVVTFFVNLLLSILSPRKMREFVYQLLGQLATRMPPKEALAFMLDLDKYVYKLTNKTAIAYNGGVHPKHRFINYKEFFISQIEPEDVVLDVGSHEGYVAHAVAEGANARVIGVELLPERVAKAQAINGHPNVTYYCADALTLTVEEPITVVVLSALLEHIEHRVDFLKQLATRYQPKKILIRVPLFSADWRNPMRKELGLNYFWDSTHYIEYTEAEFIAETSAAGLQVDSMTSEWGALYAVCSPVSSAPTQAALPEASALQTR